MTCHCPRLPSVICFPTTFESLGRIPTKLVIGFYFGRVVELLAIARARVVVLGSGWMRNIPEGWTKEQAETLAVGERC